MNRWFCLTLNTILVLLFVSLPTFAGVDTKKLLGKWEGEMAVNIPIDGKVTTDKTKLTMEFRSDGKMITISEDNKKEEENTYEVKENQIIITDSKNKAERIKLINISLDDTRFKASVIPAAEKDKDVLPTGVSIVLELKRIK